jgi:hypothetical protein
MQWTKLKLDNIVNLNNIVVKKMEPRSDLIARMGETEWLRMIYDIQTQKLIDAIIQKNTFEIKNNYYKNKIVELQRENRRLGSDRVYHMKLLFEIQQQLACFVATSGKTDLDMLHDSMLTFEPSYRYGSPRICT